MPFLDVGRLEQGRERAHLLLWEHFNATPLLGEENPPPSLSSALAGPATCFKGLRGPALRQLQGFEFHLCECGAHWPLGYPGGLCPVSQERCWTMLTQGFLSAMGLTSACVIWGMYDPEMQAGALG